MVHFCNGRWTRIISQKMLQAVLNKYIKLKVLPNYTDMKLYCILLTVYIEYGKAKS